MRGVTFSYFFAYFLFAYTTKSLSHSHDATLLALASTLACCLVCVAGFIAEAALATSRSQRPVALTVFRRLNEPDVVVAALGSAAVLLASTLAYSQPDVSLLLPLLLMKGGVLLWGPVVDWLRGEVAPNKSRAVLALAALAVALVLWQKFSLSSLGVGVALVCAVVYVVAYFPKIHVMARHKGDVDFLLAEMTLTLAIALPGAFCLALVHALRGVEGAGVVGSLPIALHALQRDLGPLLREPKLYALGLGSEGAGLFGGLLFLAPTAATLNVPLNRCTSLLAGFCATVALWVVGGGALWGYVVRNVYEVGGVVAMCGALVVGLSGGGGKRREVVEVTPLSLVEVAA